MVQDTNIEVKYKSKVSYNISMELLHAIDRFLLEISASFDKIEILNNLQNLLQF